MKNNIKTNWVVITGAPCSGKTTTIEALARRNLVTLHEVARQIMEEERAKGLTLEDLRRDRARLQGVIMQRKTEMLSRISPSQLVFMDRGIPDSIAYYRLMGLDPAEAIEASKQFRYRAVFIMERLPLVIDNIRTEDEALAQKLDIEIEENYRALGYHPLRVPVLPIEERADFILGHLSDMPAEA